MSRSAPLAALLTLAACGPPAAMVPSPVTPLVAGAAPGPDTVALVREIPRLLSVSDIPGLSIAVVQNGRVTWARGFGTLDDSARSPVEVGTIFEAASLSKPVFAYLVLRLADRGEVDLDRPLYQVLPYPRLEHDARYRKITARMVLSHGTGLPNWGGDTLDLRFDPGTAYGYSGEAFVYLQKVIERITGQPLAALARREVFAPLGMTSSSYVWEPRFAGHSASARDWLWRVAPVHRYEEADAAASLLTTATDYARFVAAVLSGRGLSAAMWHAYLTPVRETDPGLAVGLGIRVEERPSGPTFYHSGNNGRRFTCYMTGDVASGTGFVYFTNTSNGTSLVGALAPAVFGAANPARNWATFDRYDDPLLLAQRSVERAAAEHGAARARARLRAIAANPATRPSFDGTLELGAFFAGRGLHPLALEVLRRAVSDAPDSAAAHLALGRALESSGQVDSAIASYRRAEALGADEAGRFIRWAGARLAARDEPVVVGRATLERYAGRYQERTITMRDGRLYYRRGDTPDSPLTAMSSDLFEVAADPTLRIRFLRDTADGSIGMKEISSDGTTEESPRSR